MEKRSPRVSPRRFRLTSVSWRPTLAADGLLLKIEDIYAGYGKLEILHGVRLEVNSGELVCIIGPNGAGKSTAFKTVVGLVHPTSGRVIFDGADITRRRPDQMVSRGLSYVPQGRIVFPQMTGLENLEMGAYIENDSAALRRRGSGFTGSSPFWPNGNARKLGPFLVASSR